MKLLFTSFVALSAVAMPASGAPPVPNSSNGIEQAVTQYVLAQTKGLPGQVRFSIGPLDPRSQIGPCSNYEPFLPANGRLWGRVTVGVKCLAPSTWTVYLPVQVSVFGRYLRSLRPLAPGQPVASGDFELAEGDLTELPANVLTDASQAVGKPPRMGLAAGQPLRADQLITPPAIRQGQTVKLISNGPGFVVTSEGKALTNAAEGQTVTVRAASGQTISGIARIGGVVEITY